MCGRSHLSCPGYRSLSCQWNIHKENLVCKWIAIGAPSQDKFPILVLFDAGFDVDRSRVSFNHSFFYGVEKGSSLPIVLSSLFIIFLRLTLSRIVYRWNVYNKLLAIIYCMIVQKALTCYVWKFITWILIFWKLIRWKSIILWSCLQYLEKLWRHP